MNEQLPGYPAPSGATTAWRAPSGMLVLFCAAAAFVSGCGSGDDPPPVAPPPPAPPPAPALLTCTDTMKTAFKPDANTNVVLVKAFKQGDVLTLSGATTGATAAADLCLVKMIVGPGASGAASAPSTSPGIGIEVWLPATTAWNGRIRNLGGGGWAGGSHTSTTAIGNSGAAGTAANEKYVVGTTDTGHSGGNGSFAMREDGGINTALWTDFADRSLHELAVKTKALVLAYYGKAQTYAYWEGCSTGGRQGYKVAQEYGSDYDGYLNGAPAFNWTKFITSELYPQVVMRRDTGGPIAAAKINAIGAAAVSACDSVNGQHLGFIPDPRQCRYDPTRDAAVLCTGTVGNGGVVGTNATSSCVSLPEATALNKIWYGQTVDGSVPDPAVDNASTATIASSNQLWWGLARGSQLTALAGANPFAISSDMVALELQDSTYATPQFTNAISNGLNRWQTMTYVDLANAFYQGIALQPSFGNINADNPNLAKARDSKAKILTYHGLADTLITPMGSINYYTRASSAMGGNVELNKFNRLFLIPGMGHCAGVGTVSGSAGPAASVNNVPLPATNQLFNALVSWVESASVPNSIVLNSADSSVSMPVCPFPQKATYNGSGSPTTATSYGCR